MQSDLFKHRPPRSWIKITLQAPAVLTEALSTFLAELCKSGIELGDSSDNTETLIGYLEDNSDLHRKQQKLQSYLTDLNKLFPGYPPISVATESLEEIDWGQKWKEHFKTVRITERITVKPSWEEYSAGNNETIIELDPGMAFGTGLHQSTKMVLEYIDRIYTGNDLPPKVLDVGTGTGILAMACAFLGAKKVVALDNDPDAVATASDNIANNHLESKVTASDDSLTDLDSDFDLVLANIIHDTLIELAPVLACRLKQNGQLVLSGILKGEQESNIIRHYCKVGLDLKDRLHKDEWVAIRFTKKQP
ncbi:MAG: 50S ribosomal protein L11 methyltransferase [Proteobacteria bacterium]|nr:50S ribosomal protein L11 methyltransferase [Pseudomonadota bacterium]MBU1708985.1 50S ribosomal protein L11 methyltransferase [Pseudomonadota bacterium]